MSSENLHYKTIAELSGLLQKKEISPVELAAETLKRIERLDSELQSYATVMAEEAMEAAKRAEAEIQAGNYRGPLHGIPVAVKDLCYTRGVRTMGGCKVLTNHIPDFDSTVVERFKAAGAVLLGKLNLTEGAMGGYNPNFQIPKNPWNPLRWSGASSSGSGAATAAGLCFGSLGSDTGGSIRFPSAACGTVGLKPTWGRISRYGVIALAESLDHVGPLTRSSIDAGIILQAIAGEDPKDLTTLPYPAPQMPLDVQNGIEGVRIGFDERYASQDVDPELSKAIKAAVMVLKESGAKIIEVVMPEMDDYIAAWPTLCSAEAVAAHRKTYPSRRDEYGLFFKGWLDMGAKVSGADYADANRLRAACTGQLNRVFKHIDLLACPAMLGPARKITPGEGYGPMPPLDAADTRRKRFTAPFDFNGAPTLTLPCGMSSEKLPLSLQLCGKSLSEPLLCHVGAAYERATDWHTLHPDL